MTLPEMNSKAPMPGETGVGMTTIIPLIAACTIAYLSWTTQPFQFTVLSDQTQFGPVLDRKSTRLNSSHESTSRMPSSA